MSTDLADDNIGTGYTTGTPRDSFEGFADGAIEFIEALALPKVDLLGWTLGGTVAQHVILRRPDLVRKLVVAASNPGGQVADAPAPREKVRGIMAQSEVTGDDMVYLFSPRRTRVAPREAEHLAKVATRLATELPSVSEAAAKGQVTAIAQNASVPFERVRGAPTATLRPRGPAFASGWGQQLNARAHLVLASQARVIERS